VSTVAQVGSISTSCMVKMMTAPTGLPYTVAAIGEREGQPLVAVETSHVTGQNIAFELAEKSAGVKYPAFYVYCEKVTNTLREKFRTFSGKARMAVEVRVSQDRLEDIQRRLELYVESVTEVLDAHRGDWGQGMFYAGGYEVSFGPTKHGGKNFVQAATISFDVDVSIS
jgi:hypothetical protein